MGGEHLREWTPPPKTHRTAIAEALSFDPSSERRGIVIVAFEFANREIISLRFMRKVDCGGNVIRDYAEPGLLLLQHFVYAVVMFLTINN